MSKTEDQIAAEKAAAEKAAAEKAAAEKAAAPKTDLFEFRSVCGGPVHHPYRNVWIESSWSAEMPMDAWLQLQKDAGKVQARPASAAQ